MQILNSIGQALFMSFNMFWEILWPLILGFSLSAIVQAVVSHNAMAKTLGGNGSRSLTFATLSRSTGIGGGRTAGDSVRQSDTVRHPGI